ncbi:Cytidine deaminase 5 [Chamberlinius hualienensis]
MKVLTYTLFFLVTWVKVKSNDPAVPCVEDQCSLPNCYCSSTSFPPGITDITESPQIVMLNFDDSVEPTLYDAFYSQLLQYKNPNGCNIGLNFMITHDYTDYTMAHDLWQSGCEFISNSISGLRDDPTHIIDYSEWYNEMYGMKQIVSNLANIPMEDIVGSQPPLGLGGDVMLQAVYDSGFQYDVSLITMIYNNSPLYPYTLDYKTTQHCDLSPCPRNSYPGLWEIPVIDFNSTNGYPCVTLDSCTGVTGNQTTFEFLLNNFNFHYQTNRAPIGYFTHGSWFLTDPTHFSGYIQFIDYLQTLPDVFIITAKKALEWMKNPTKTADISNFEPWKCDSIPASPCIPRTCHYTDTPPGGPRTMECCVPCPINYPWVGDPYGNNTTF